MGILNFYPGIGNLGLLGVFLRPFVIRNHDTFSFLELVRKLCLTISGGKSQDYYENGKSQHLVRISIVFFCFSFISWLLVRRCFPSEFLTALNCPDLEDRHHHRVWVALAYAYEIEDFDDLVDPRRLFDYFLGPKPSKYVLEKICWDEKSKIIFISFICTLPNCLLENCSFFFFSFSFVFYLAEMATRYSKEKYARIKNLKNEPLSNLTTDSKKRKLSNEKAETATLSLVHIAHSSPTPSLEVTAFTPPTTHAKGKGKVGKSV